jgi:hypothetical protein
VPPATLEQLAKILHLNLTVSAQFDDVEPVALLKARVNDEIAANETLKSASQQYGGGTSTYLMARLLDEQMRVSARQELSGLTRTQITENVYNKLRDDDEGANAMLRLIENAVVTKTLDRLGLKDDPMSDAVAIGKLTKMVEARRKARVPAWLFEAKARLENESTTTFAFSMSHLRRGRGIAYRPRAVA